MTKIIVRIIPILILILILVACKNDSNNEIVKTIQSPNGNYVAYLFKRNMGATTKESYQLSILRKGKEFGDNSGNIFIAYGEFDIEWVNDKALMIKNKTIEKVFKDESVYDDITIRHYPSKTK